MFAAQSVRFNPGDRVLVKGRFSRSASHFRSAWSHEGERFGTIVGEPLLFLSADTEYRVRYDGDTSTRSVWDSWMSKTVTQEICDVFNQTKVQ